MEGIHVAKDLTQKYKLSNGEEVTCRPVAPHLIQVGLHELEAKWREEGRMIDKPRFKVEFARQMGKGEVWVDHYVDEATGQNSLDDPENPRQAMINWALWKQYEADRAALEQAQEEAQFKILFSHGIDYDVPPNEEWADQIAPEEIEANPLDRKFQYLWFVLLTPVDIAELRAFLALLAAGEMVTRDQMARFRRSIRPSMERAIGENLDNALAELERVAAGGGEPAEDSGGEERVGDK